MAEHNVLAGSSLHEPKAHTASHAAGGSDPIVDIAQQTANVHLKLASPKVRIQGTEGSAEEYAVGEDAGNFIVYHNAGSEASPSWSEIFRLTTAGVLTSAGNIPFTELSGTAADAQVPESAVTQHQAALAVATSQLTGTIVSVLESNTSQTGTDADTNEKTLRTYTLPGGSLASDGDWLEVLVWGVLAANADSKTVRLKFDGTTIADPVFAGVGTAGGAFLIHAIIRRTGGTSQDVMTHHTEGVSADFEAAGNHDYATPTKTLSGDLDIIVTGQNANAAANDILYEGMLVKLFEV